jgi:hypothetical protein
MILEMYDQTVRERPGGDMMAFLSQSKIPNWASSNLDTLSDGTVIRPGSLSMEAVKSEVDSMETP